MRSRRRGRFAQAGQGMIELAFVLPIVLTVILLTLNAEWSIFQVQQLRNAAAAAVRATAINSPSDNPPDIVANCDAKVLQSIRQAAPLLPISSSANLCIPGANTNVLLLHDGSLTICVTADSTVYSPSQVTAVVKDQLPELVPVPLFDLNVTETSDNTVGTAGIPGTVTATPSSICP
jgi:Flp pilus assembly protein TadG